MASQVKDKYGSPETENQSYFLFWEKGTNPETYVPL